MKWLAVLLVSLAFLIVGCETDSSYDRDKNTVNDQQGVYAGSQPVPFFNFSQTRDTLIQIYNQVVPEARSTFSVFFSFSGTPLYVCPSRGYPIPADTQLTNPLRDVPNKDSVIEQPEPSGVYTSKNTNATWVLCVRANGDVVPVYSEPMVLTFPFPVVIEAGQIVEVDGGASSLKVNLTPAP